MKNITANGWMIIYVGADYVSSDNHSLCIKIFGKRRESFLIYAYGFAQHHMIGVIVHLYPSLARNMQILQVFFLQDLQDLALKTKLFLQDIKILQESCKVFYILQEKLHF